MLPPTVPAGTAYAQLEPGLFNKTTSLGSWAMPLTELENTLRPIARERIAKGQLPRQEPSRMWGGPGNGKLCSLCDKPIEPYQIEYEIEHGESAVQTSRFHSACLSIWQLECVGDYDSRKSP
jgi:hypothetical protein